ncbi:TPA: hypothetical protein QEM76_005861 [Pseudomonas putida]|uniref:hypothetical protein n=1 Tax=Pseudomonas putida TaxID=303 RepID=UPI00235C29EE|nr:hypothetical protein [Pseudomonas putida]GLO09877.1 hypothetical protein PPUJ20005_38460 [Pseudomonas putida]HDS0987038.1 hypothetical protein [Pseudomonas putida]HDS1803101.1 hypothetical protein [Pseudomonas putida]HDS1809062.1 hypothetical protein [Pseudomonas putida]
MSIHRTRTTLVDDHWTDSYARVAEKVALAREIFAARGIKIRSGSALHQLLRQADKLDQAWVDQREPDAQIIIDALHVNRLVDAINLVGEQPGIHEPLKRMAKSVMQPNDRGLSQGKDALWELVLQAQLISSGVSARAAEPDLIVELNMADYPIACKKIWSADNLENQIKRGCEQLAPFGHAGVIALNLDDLTPVGKVVAQPTKTLAIEFLAEFTTDFIGKHLRLLQQAVVKGRCDGFIVSTAAAAILSEEDTSPYLATHYTLWHSTDKSPEAIDRFLAFARAMNLDR